MTQNLKIEVLTGDISIDGIVVTNLVTKEELSTAIVKKADLGTDGKIPTSQLPAEIVNTAGIVDEVKLQLETSIKDAVDESNAYAESYTDNALSSKADLTSGKVPLEQLPTIDQYPQFGTALSNLSTSILNAMKQRTDQLEKSKADLGEDGLFLYGGPNRNVIIGHPGAQGTFLGSANVLTLAGAEDVPEGGITHRFKAGFGSVTHIYQTGSDGSNTAATAIRIPTNTTTGRSINAGGTVNASGADYAEYMYKADGCIGIEKGEVVGVDVDGKLTKVYDDAISFVIKSTNPSIVGGDKWFNESFDENEPTNTFNEVLSEDASAVEIDQFNARRVSYAKKLEADILEYKDRLKSFNDRLEVERQKVDRIAFCGQVPIAYEASSGDYIIPLRNTDGSIGIETTKQPTFEQHLKCVGKVWKVVDSVPYVVVFNN